MEPWETRLVRSLAKDFKILQDLSQSGTFPLATIEHNHGWFLGTHYEYRGLVFLSEWGEVYLGSYDQIADRIREYLERC